MSKLGTKDWYGKDFVFLPAYSPSVPASAGRMNYTYTLLGQFGTIYATDMESSLLIPNNKQVRWDSYAIRFHYPAEHTLVKGTVYDLEM